MLDHADNGAGVEQIRAVLDLTGDALIGILQIEAQFIFRAIFF